MGERKYGKISSKKEEEMVIKLKGLITSQYDFLWAGMVALNVRNRKSR